ncbi:bifunctional nuclease family protein [candidate division KSB1 bacterium]|nr:bifunctional nuclease family protein [candidate division KSB1 bacterium]MBL7095260.1 bifunctional nuclease family protein [candidate division KSB1 bacterium]
MHVAVRVDRVTLDTSTNRFVVILKDDVHGRWLPIVVGTTEAQAIALQLEGIMPPRPLTHDLMKNLMESIKAEISRIVVNDLRENTYFAAITLQVKKNAYEIDARPSDAIALALRMQAPIFVDEKVMKKAAVIDQTTISKGAFEESDRPFGDIDQMEELNIKLQKAVREERFEEAAKIRDEILDLKHERHQI